MKPAGVIIDGRLFCGRPKTHRFVATFPPRVVVIAFERTLPGTFSVFEYGPPPYPEGTPTERVRWRPRCHLCRQRHTLWMTHDVLWEELPARYRPVGLCVPCFLKLRRGLGARGRDAKRQRSVA